MRNTHFRPKLIFAQYALRDAQRDGPMTCMKVGTKIRELRKAKEMTLLAVETAAGLSPGNLSRIERGTQWVSEETLRAIASAIGVKVAALFSDDQFNAEEKLQIAPGRYVAIVGIGMGGPDGYISIDDYPPGEGDGYILTHSNDASAYGIRVRGDSMRPRIKSGEFIIAEPTREAQPGDDVVVRMKDGRALVKEYLYQRDGEISLGSVNNDVAPITLPLGLVESIHRVAAIIPQGSALIAKQLPTTDRRTSTQPTEGKERREHNIPGDSERGRQ